VRRRTSRAVLVRVCGCVRRRVLSDRRHTAQPAPVSRSTLGTAQPGTSPTQCVARKGPAGRASARRPTPQLEEGRPSRRSARSLLLAKTPPTRSSPSASIPHSHTTRLSPKQPTITQQLDDGALRVYKKVESRAANATHGLVRALASNMVVGTTEGFTKTLTLIGVGYRAAVKGDVLTLSLGYSHPVEMPIPKGLTVTVDKTTTVNISGADKVVVGQFAADVRAKRPPEPYKGKGVRYVDEFVRRKEGKRGK
jgi:large subunit ribosomal protein L6